MTAPAKQSVEEAKEECEEAATMCGAETVERAEFRAAIDSLPEHLHLAYAVQCGFVIGHNYRDAEVEAMRAKRIEELEGLAKDMCHWCAKGRPITPNGGEGQFWGHAAGRDGRRWRLPWVGCLASPIHAAIAQAKGEVSNQPKVEEESAT